MQEKNQEISNFSDSLKYPLHRVERAEEHELMHPRIHNLYYPKFGLETVGLHTDHDAHTQKKGSLEWDGK